MDKIKAEHLKTGHRVKLAKPLPGRPAEEYGVITLAVQVDDGVVEPIYKLSFEGSDFCLMCNASREFEVETSTPGKLRRHDIAR